MRSDSCGLLIVKLPNRARWLGREATARVAKVEPFSYLEEKASDMINWQERIHTDPQVLVGKPVIKGTRLSVEFLLERLASGWTPQELVDNYPRLQPQDIQALFAYALESLSD